MYIYIYIFICMYIYMCISGIVIDEQKYDARETKFNIDQIELLCAKIHPCENATLGLMRENLAAQKCLCLQ